MLFCGKKYPAKKSCSQEIVHASLLYGKEGCKPLFYELVKIQTMLEDG